MARNKGIYRLFRTKAEYENFVHDTRFVARTLMLDLVIITLGRMGLGEKRLGDFREKLVETVNDYTDLWEADLKDDKDMVYSQEIMERELRQHCGKNYAPKEIRYDVRIM